MKIVHFDESKIGCYSKLYYISQYNKNNTIKKEEYYIFFNIYKIFNNNNIENLINEIL